MNDPTPAKLQEKWLVLLVWFALLAALVYTSRYAVEQSVLGGIAGFLRLPGAFTSGDTSEDIEVETLVRLGLMIVLISQLVLAWLKFAFLTDELFIAFAKADKPDQKTSLFEAFLVFRSVPYETTSNENEQEMETDSDEASTRMSEVLRPLAFLLAILLITPIIVEITIKLFGPETN